LPKEQIHSLIYWNDALVLPDRSELVAAPTEAQDAKDVAELLKTARDLTDLYLKLIDDEAKLRAELAKLRHQPSDRGTPLANRLIDLDAQTRALYGEVDRLRKEIEKAKK